MANSPPSCRPFLARFWIALEPVDSQQVSLDILQHLRDVHEDMKAAVAWPTKAYLQTLLRYRIVTHKLILEQVDLPSDHTCEADQPLLTK